MSGNKASGGLTSCGVVFVVFFILKLLGIITWSWWWVTAPLWMPTVLAILVLIICRAIKLIINKRGW